MKVHKYRGTLKNRIRERKKPVIKTGGYGKVIAQRLLLRTTICHRPDCHGYGKEKSIYGKRICQKERQKGGTTASTWKTESGNLVQKEYAGTESKSETEALLRKAMEDYEAKKFVARSEKCHGGRSAGYVD